MVGGMIFVVERYLPGLTRSDILVALERLQAVGDDASDTAAVRYLGSTIVLEDEACYCQFEGPSENAIAEANRRAHAPFDRIVSAVAVHPGSRKRRAAV
jgi:hypothetical protein